jgi:hypothetical protein
LTALKHSEVEAEAALNTLLDHLQNWLLAQPELLLLWTQPRGVRKQVSRMIATELMTIPTRQMNEGSEPNRAMRRQILALLKRSGPGWAEDGLTFAEPAEPDLWVPGEEEQG